MRIQRKIHQSITLLVRIFWLIKRGISRGKTITTIIHICQTKSPLFKKAPDTHSLKEIKIFWKTQHRQQVCHMKVMIRSEVLLLKDTGVYIITVTLVALMISFNFLLVTNVCDLTIISRLLVGNPQHHQASYSFSPRGWIFCLIIIPYNWQVYIKERISERAKVKKVVVIEDQFLIRVGIWSPT